MRYFKYILMLTLVFTACKSKKLVLDANVEAKEISVNKVVRKHIAANFKKETIDAKFKANFNDGKTNQSITVYLKITKDKEIFLKGTKFITVFKAKITPTSIAYYSPYAKNYFEGDFKMLKKILGTEINYEQLQSLFLGEAMLDVKKNKQNVEIVNNSYILTPTAKDLLANVVTAVNPNHFKLDFQAIASPIKKESLEIKYPSYKLIDNVVFPAEINITAKQVSKTTKIDFTLKSVEFNTVLNTSFSLPKGYKRINL